MTIVFKEGSDEMKLFDKLEGIVKKPKPFEHYTSPQLWNDPHISKSMLDAHLDPDHDVASFRKEFIDKAVNWMTSRFKLSKESRICDFGCGPGLWTTRFAELGATVTGIDLSERSIRYAQETAQKKNLTIRYILQDYLQLSMDEQFDLIIMISYDFSVLSSDQRETLLHIFHTLLSENGTVLLDASSLEAFNDASEKADHEYSSVGGFWSSEPYHLFTSSFKYERENLLCDKYAVIEKEREFTIYIWNQCYSVESLRKVFEENGFQIIEVLSDVSGKPFRVDSRRIAIVAMKST